MWRDVAAAATTSDWRSPRLDDHATGDALAVVTSVLRKDHDRGLVARGEPVLSPTLESESPSSNPTSAIVQDCGDSTDWLRYRADTGELADTPGGRRAITAEVVLSDDGTWKVARFAVREIGTC